MSDLDADLYGGEQHIFAFFLYVFFFIDYSTIILIDLYGNDELEEFHDPSAVDEKDTQSPTEAPTTDPRPAAQPAKEPTPVVKASPTEADDSAQYSHTTTTTSAPAAPTYTQPPATQQIPTYEQPQPSDYRELAPMGHEGGYQNIPVNERTVRPSEMKDEG